MYGIYLQTSLVVNSTGSGADYLLGLNSSPSTHYLNNLGQVNFPLYVSCFMSIKRE